MYRALTRGQVSERISGRTRERERRERVGERGT